VRVIDTTAAADPVPFAETEAQLTVLSRNVTPEEVAAVTAVVNGALSEELDDSAAAEALGEAEWMKRRRALRGTLRPGPGAWRHG
jgi:hypothetical protein